MKGWTPTKQEMPEKGKRVMVYYEGIERNGYSIGYLKWMGEEWIHLFPGDMSGEPDPTHWRPLL